MRIGLRKQNLFVQFLLTYLLVLLIPMSLAVWVNASLVSEFRQNLEESHLSVLRQTRDIIERSVVDLEWRAYQIAGDTRLNQLINEYRTLGLENAQLLREVVLSLNSYTLYSSTLRSTFYLYLKEPPVILTPYALYRHEDFDDRRTYLSMEGISVRDWHEQILGSYQRKAFYPATRVTIEDFTSAAMIPFVQSFPIRSNPIPSETNGVLVYFLEEGEFGSLLGNLELPDGGWAYIADQNGALLTGIVKGQGTEIRRLDLDAWDNSSPEGLQSMTFENQNFLVIRTQSPSGWEYVAVLPEEPVLYPVVRLQRISLWSLAISLLASMVFASVISFRRARPLQELLSTLREAVGSEQILSLDSINSGVHRLIDRSQHLQEQLQKQEVFHQNQLVKRLLEGSFRNRNELRSFLGYLRMNIVEEGFTAAVISLRGFPTLETVHMIEEMNRTKVVLKELVRSVYRDRVLIHDSEEESVAMILMSGEGPEGLGPAALNPSWDQLQNSLAEVYHAPLGIAVGSPRSDILEVSASWEEAKLALGRWDPDNPRRPVYFEGSMVDTASYSYPLDLEIRISNAVRAGDSQILDDCFRHLRQENIERRGIPHAQLKLLYHELFGTYRKLLDGMSLPPGAKEELSEFYSAGEGYPLDELIKEFFVIAEHQHGSKKSHNKELLDRILEVLQTHVNHPGLSLSMIASACSITESYLSFFFKEQTGENFSSYVENLRVSKSLELLKQTEASVAEIAEMVGYNSDKTFRRVFKKLQGVSPSEFRLQNTLKRIV